jgi:FKBP-type peptidyl-prolyl cis-trans isomerase
MKTKLLTIGLVVALTGIAMAQNKKAPVVGGGAAPGAPAAAKGGAAPEDEKAKIGYAIGFHVGSSLKDQGEAIDIKAVVAGMQDAMGGAKPALTEAEMRAAMMGLQKRAQAKMAEQAKAEGEKNKKEGEAYLAANAKKPGVKTTKSGLQYKVLKEGTGKTPKATDTVKTHYTGTLVDGTKFDSSVDRGEPVEFGVTQVIPGWTEALQMMKVGSKWQLVIPWEIAYGADGGGRMPPNSVLLFDIELLDVVGESIK